MYSEFEQNLSKESAGSSVGATGEKIGSADAKSGAGGKSDVGVGGSIKSSGGGSSSRRSQKQHQQLQQQKKPHQDLHHLQQLSKAGIRPNSKLGRLWTLRRQSTEDFSLSDRSSSSGGNSSHSGNSGNRDAEEGELGVRRTRQRSIEVIQEAPGDNVMC